MAPALTEDPMTREDDLRILTADELAKILRVGRTTVYRWAHEGQIPVIRVGRTVRFDLADVRKALESHKAGE